MAKEPKYPIPNLANMTVMGLVDILGEYKEKEAEAKFYSGFYREALSAQMHEKNSELGEVYEVHKSFVDAERIDVSAIRADANAGDKLAKQVLAKYLKSSSSVQYRTSRRATPEVK